MTLLTTEKVSQLTQEIWASLLAPEGSPQLLEGEVGGPELIALTNISGEWNGTVSLSCSRQAARHASAAMFGIPDDELTEDDITDAVGELINVVGGNIKSLVPGPTVLSLPRVSAHDEHNHPGHLELVQQVHFSWMAEPVVVSVWTDPTPR